MFSTNNMRLFEGTPNDGAETVAFQEQNIKTQIAILLSVFDDWEEGGAN